MEEAFWAGAGGGSEGEREKTEGHGTRGHG